MNINKILFFNNIRKNKIVRLAANLSTEMESLSSTEKSGKKIEKLCADYFEIQRRLLSEIKTADTSGTYWENHIYKLVAESENMFSLVAEHGMPSENVLKVADGDVEEIKALLNIDWSKIADLIKEDRVCVCTLEAPFEEDSRASIVKSALAADDIRKSTEALASYYRQNFCGILGKYKAFIWHDELCGVKNHDPITFKELLGYETQQQQLIRNTEVFVQGRHANNVLLYGDKGTGKSSSVKALLNMFADQGLRMINVPKENIFDINKIMESVSSRGCRFIIFIDDLSFESTEIEYKKFKSVLEGGVEIQPDNVLVYVTSNRRNLVKESWSDRNESTGEVNSADGMQERQSLADRFGLTITFMAPDRKLYNEMIKSMADKEGLEIDEDVLLAEANKWDMRQTSRSGRAAKQFITHIAEMEQ